MLNMMKSIYKQLFAFVATICFAISVPAQDLPKLASDQSVKQGVLPNGMTYYIAADKSQKGTADFALVQKTGLKTDPLSSKAVEAARKALSYVPRLEERSPQEFMTSHGASAGNGGFVEVRDDATVFRFPGVRIADGKTVLDSALLVIMDMTERVRWTDDEYVRKWYAPSDQAVIVAGDVDAGVVAEKLKMLSYMTPKLESAARKEYVWESRPRPVMDFSPAGVNGLAPVSMTWRSARPPRSYMNTVQPETFSMTMNILGSIACSRIYKALMGKDIPVADVTYGYADASEGPYDESFSVTAFVDADDAQEALLVIGEVMASLDGPGAAVNEYRMSRSAYLDGLSDAAMPEISPEGEYVDRCIAAFLYNSSLASTAGRLQYHESRNLPDTTGVRLFNDIVSAILDGSKDLTVRCPGVDDGTSFKSRLDSVWYVSSSAGLVNSSAPNLRDTVSFPDPGDKVRIKSGRKDHLSGGTVWTFSNGFKVVYKKMPSSGRVFYTLALNGGYGSIPDLDAGEGAYLSDYLDLCYVAGLKGTDFRKLLAAERIDMQTRVNLSNTLVNGYAPKEKMGLLMKSLAALARDRRPDKSAFSYYMACEELALKLNEGTRLARMTAIDSIMCPGYKYSSYKSPGKLDAGLAAKAEKFYTGQFAKMNDGVLAIVGDIEENALKKVLLEYIGAFPTKETAFRRPVVKYQPVSGWSTYTVDGVRGSIDVVMSARMPLTAENYASAAVASMILEQRLAEAVAEAGMTMDISYNCRIYPEERLNMIISVSEAPEAGFAENVKAMKAIDALDLIRGELSGMSAEAIDDARLAACKASLKNEVSLEMKDPLYWTNAIALRYLDGKDFTNGNLTRIDAVNAKSVKAIFELLESGSKVEYVIKGE